MARVFLLHWHQQECEDRAAALCSAGHTVAVHFRTETSPALKDSLPDIAVISLDRLPSHGRAVAEWFWEAKKRQHIPIIFAGGESQKVAATRAKFPRAVYCTTPAIVETVDRLAAQQLTALGTPSEMAPRRATRQSKPSGKVTRTAKGSPQRAVSKGPSEHTRK